MTRPTPDGRDWLTPAAIVRSMLEAVWRNHPNMNRTQLEALREDLKEGYRDTNYHNEFKILRLTEMIYGHLRAGHYDSLAQIREDFDTAYNMEVLNGIDDNGNPL